MAEADIKVKYSFVIPFTIVQFLFFYKFTCTYHVLEDMVVYVLCDLFGDMIGESKILLKS